VSRREEREEAETVADRIEAIRRTIPPAPGRRSRLGYISKDDFAELIGTGRTRVIAWTTGQAYPEARYRERLAELSKGRWLPADFARDAAPTDRLAALEAEVERLADALDTAGKAYDRLRARVRALERAAGDRPARARQAELAMLPAPTRHGTAAR
jgi:hypothetical protein